MLDALRRRGPTRRARRSGVEVTRHRRVRGYAYDLYFSDLADAPEGAADRPRRRRRRSSCPAPSVDRLRGSRLEFASDGGGGLVLVNPNTPRPKSSTPACPRTILALGIEGDRWPRRRRRCSTTQVNPAIASPRRARRPRRAGRGEEGRLPQDVGRVPGLRDEPDDALARASRRRCARRSPSSTGVRRRHRPRLGRQPLLRRATRTARALELGDAALPDRRRKPRPGARPSSSKDFRRASPITAERDR